MTNETDPTPTVLSAGPIACNLAAAEQAGRADDIHVLFRHAQATRELADGYAVQFPGTIVWASRLLDFIAAERACCPFLAFALVWEPQHGPLWLHLRGPEGTKAFLRDLLPDVSQQVTAPIPGG